MMLHPSTHSAQRAHLCQRIDHPAPGVGLMLQLLPQGGPRASTPLHTPRCRPLSSSCCCCCRCCLHAMLLQPAAALLQLGGGAVQLGAGVHRPQAGGAAVQGVCSAARHSAVQCNEVRTHGQSQMQGRLIAVSSYGSGSMLLTVPTLA